MNDRIFIEGGHKLKGNVQIQGSKNAALPMMAASLLHRGVSVLKGCPRIADVFCMEEILQNLGAVTWWEDHDLYLESGQNRGPIFLHRENAVFCDPSGGTSWKK